jgi:hypothetical protein
VPVKPLHSTPAGSRQAKREKLLISHMDAYPSSPSYLLHRQSSTKSCKESLPNDSTAYGHETLPEQIYGFGRVSGPCPPVLPTTFICRGRGSGWRIFPHQRPIGIPAPNQNVLHALVDTVVNASEDHTRGWSKCRLKLEAATSDDCRPT